jgi:PAS domain S-box-containing protein
MLATLARTASRILDAPICAVTLIDHNTVRILASHGFDMQQLDRRVSFCGECVRTKEPLIVEDATLDPRFAGLPLVTEGGIGHYAGVPLIASDGNAIGTFCILGPGYRSITADDLQTLHDFASTATQLLEQKRLLLEHDAQRDLCLGVLDASMDGVYTLTEVRDASNRIIDFRVTMLNSRAEQLLQTKANAVVGTLLTQAFPGVNGSGLLTHYKAVTETGTPFRNEIYYDSPTLRGWFEVSAVRVGDGVAVTFANIDHRKSAEAELRLNNERFRLVTTATEDMVWNFDLVNNTIWLSDNFSLGLGYPIEDIDHHINWCYDKLHPEDRQPSVESFEEALRSGQNKWSTQYRMQRADGSYATLLDRAFIIRDESGKPIRAVGACIDLTERLQASHDLEIQRTILEAQAQATQDAILVTDASHRIVQSNQRFEELVDTPIKNTSPHIAISAIYAKAINAKQVENRVRLAIDDPSLTIKDEIEYRDGRAFELHSEPLRDRRGTFLGRVWFVRDLTRQRQSSQILRAHNMVLEASGVVVFRWKPQPGWPVELVSKNVEQFGYTAEELLAQEYNFVEMVHPDDHERVGGEVAGYIESGRDCFEQEYRIICRDGSVRWVYDQTVIDRDRNGNLESLQGIIIDITERRRVEQELAQNEAMLKELTSQIPGAVYQYRHRADGTAEMPYISEGIREVCGISPCQVYRDSNIIRSMVLPEDLDDFDNTISESARTMKPWQCEFRLRTSSGEVRWIGGNSMPRREPDGSIIWHGMMSDVTARKEAEETLRRTTLLLERTNAMAHVGGWEVDIQTQQLYLSNEVKRILEIDPAATITLSDCLTYYTAESRSRLEPAMHQAIEHGRAYDLELQIITPSGQHRWVRAQGEAIRRSGKTIKLRGALHDIHDQYLAREEIAARAAELEVLRDAAEAASRAKSEFIANMSHEIRTPLTAILGFAELLRDENATSESAAEHNRTADTILAAGQHLLTVINDILDISKIEAGRMHLDPEEFDLPVLLRDAASLMHARAESKGIRISIKAGSTIPQRIVADPTRLRQVILNLLGNAVKFTEIGTVNLTVARDTDHEAPMLVIDIEDTGPGIQPEHQAQLFCAFTQADSSLRRRHGGTGLGLSISRRFVQLMGGTIELVRSEPGRGSLFRIRLPLEEAEGTSYTDSLELCPLRIAPAKPQAIALIGRILFAEDGPDNQRLISFHLRKAGAEVDIADNGRIALERFIAAQQEGKPYDLVLTDIQMPEMDGIEFTKALRAAAATTPIIAVTAHAMVEDRLRCIEAGCNDYTTKPIQRELLLGTCQKWLAINASRADKAA